MSDTEALATLLRDVLHPLMVGSTLKDAAYRNIAARLHAAGVRVAEDMRAATPYNDGGKFPRGPGDAWIIECLCGDVFTTTEDMALHLWMAHGHEWMAHGHEVPPEAAPSDPAAPLDVERLARAMYPVPLAKGQTWDDAMQDAIEVAAAYATPAPCLDCDMNPGCCDTHDTEEAARE